MSRAPRDQSARELAVRWTEGPILVEAGAGTGKTDLLVRRVLHLVRSEGIDIERIVAITFTIKAAAELRSRIRAALSGAFEKETDEEARVRFREALDRIDRAPISTIHSFAMRLLQERPIEAGLRPGAGDVDTDAHDDLRDRLWEGWLRERMTGGDPAIEMFLELGFGLKNLEEVRDALLDFPELRAGFPIPENRSPAEIKETVRASFRRWRALADSIVQDKSDKAYLQLEELSGWVEGLPDSNLIGLIRELWSPSAKLNKNLGGIKAWGGREGRKAFRDGYDGFLEESLAGAGHEVLSGLAASLSVYADALAARAREEGILDFAGILFHAARLVRESPEARADFQGRFDHFLVDEFQDTDPLQAELIFRLAGEGGGADDWRKVKLTGGGLFVVGDPKQSIYRFRRADIAIYHGVKNRIADSPGGKVIQITENFRSAPGVTNWVNAVFGRIIVQRGSVQPGYEPLNAFRRDAGARVRLLAGGELEGKMSAGERRRREAACVAAEVRRLVDEKTVVHPKNEEPRPVRYGDIVLVSRTRGAFSNFEEAFGRLNIPVSADGGSGFYETAEVAAAGAVLWAAVHPGDPLAVAAALRSPLYGFSDVDLARWRLCEKDTLGYPAEMDGAAAEMEEFHERRGEMSPRALLEEIFRRTQAFELFLSSFNGERRVANLLKLLDLAFEFAGGGARGVDEFALHLKRQLAHGREAKEPEEAAAGGGGDDVRLMSIHASKGLEFPVVILVDLGSAPRADEMARIADRESGRIHLKTGPKGRGLTSAGYARAREREAEIQEAERRRLLYVAATRARDWLILPAAEGAGESSFWKILIEGGAAGEGMREEVERLTEMAEVKGAGELIEPGVLRLPENAFEANEEKRRAALRRRAGAEKSLAALGEPGPGFRFIGPSSLPEGAGAEAEDWEAEAAGEAGRYGISSLEAGGAPGGRKFGELVHALLARLGSYDRAGVDALAEEARAAAAGFGLSDKEIGEAVAMIRGATEGALFGRIAASGRVFRELPVLMREGDWILRGVADLVFEEGGALVVVDFKTDAVSGADVDRRAAHYRPQGAAYAMAAGAAAGQEVREVIFAFLRPGAESAFPLDGAAQEEVRRAAGRIHAGREA
ncbi:MAG TPA: hypothetical protein DDZ83_00710 [Nitrospinae bacterium]|nr:hypothetical protein [Nitrospinota bacterium]